MPLTAAERSSLRELLDAHARRRVQEDQRRAEIAHEAATGQRICRWCGAEYVPKSGNSKYCCAEHRRNAWEHAHPRTTSTLRGRPRKAVCVPAASVKESAPT